MRVAALSDFHLGPLPGADAFGHEPSTFLKFLLEVRRHVDSIVLLGDIWQADHGWGLGPASQASGLRKVRSMHPWLETFLVEAEPILIAGNHDATSEGQAAARSQWIAQGPAGKVRFLHGHQMDGVINRAPWPSALGTWACGRLRAGGLGALAGALEGADVRIKARLNHGTGGATLARARGARGNLEGLVMGHTHVGGIWMDQTGWVANTGSCSRGRYSGVLVDLAAGQVQYVDGLTAWRKALFARP